MGSGRCPTTARTSRNHQSDLEPDVIDAIALPMPDQFDPATMNAMAFLAGFEKPMTRESYTIDLRIFFRWCQSHNLNPLTVKRAHLQAYVVYLREERGNQPSTICRRLASVSGYFDTAVLDNLIEHSPAHHLKLPKIDRASAQREWLNRFELGSLVKAARDSSPLDEVTVHLLGTIGMRVGAVCAVDIEHISMSPDGYHVVKTTGKGGKTSRKAIPVPVWPAVEALIGGRTSGPLLLRKCGRRANRASVDRALQRLMKAADIGKKITPHSLRRSHATNLIKAGVDLQVIQEGMDHASVKTTQGYNQARLDNHAQASHVLASLIANVS
jgi:site-specific recombinase XerD